MIQWNVSLRMSWLVLMLASATFIFVVLLFSTCLPYAFLRNYSANASPFLVSVLGCASCGVFIATCFLGLVPHVRHQEMTLRNSTIANEAFYFPSTDELIVIGFLLILITEQLISGLGMSIDSRNTYMEPQSQVLKMRQLLEEEEGEDAQPLVDVDAYGEESDNVDIIFRENCSAPLSHGAAPGVKHGNSNLRVWFLLLGMSVHSFFEGIALGVQKESSAFTQVLFAIMLHEVLCCISYGVQLAKQSATKTYAWTSAIFLSATIPIGMILAVLIDGVQAEKWQQVVRYWLEGLAAGTFVHVALVELLPMELHSEGGHGHSHSIVGDDDGHSHSHHHAKRSQWRNLVKAVFVALGIGIFVVIKNIIRVH